MGDYELNTTGIDEASVATISQILRDNNIPCVLYGNLLLSVYGVPSIVESIDYVVPDELVAASVGALHNRGLKDYNEPKTCRVNAERRPSPPPAAHFHMDSELTVAFYNKSSTFWFLPSLELSSKLSSSSRNIVLASDPKLPTSRPGRGHGAFQPGLFSVLIPSAECLLESYIRLLARADGHQYQGFWLWMITYVQEYMDGDGFLEEANLETRCRTFYSEFKKCDIHLELLLETLRADFSEPLHFHDTIGNIGPDRSALEIV